MAMSGESVRAAALRCACSVVEIGTSESKIIEVAGRFEAWIAAGASGSPSTGTGARKPTNPLDLPLTPGEQALVDEEKEKKPWDRKKKPYGQPAHQPPCYPGTCPACDFARGRGEI